MTGHQRKNSRSPHQPGPSGPAWVPVMAIGWPVVGGVARQLHRPGRPIVDPPPRGIAMTLKPIPGAPMDAPVPDFPTGEPGPLVVPASRFTRRPVSPLPPLPPPSPSLAPARRPGAGRNSRQRQQQPHIPMHSRGTRHQPVEHDHLDHRRADRGLFRSDDTASRPRDGRSQSVPAGVARRRLTDRHRRQPEARFPGRIRDYGRRTSNT